MNTLRSKKGFICDMDGVIYHGNRLLPGVKEFVDWLYRENKNFPVPDQRLRALAQGASAEAAAHGTGGGREPFLYQRAGHRALHKHASRPDAARMSSAARG